MLSFVRHQTRPRFLLAFGALVSAAVLSGACALDAGDPKDGALGTSLSGAEQDAALPTPTDLGGPAPACETDTDCGTLALCIAHVCQAACENPSMCAPGSTCNFDNGGYCWNYPGCNPPPPGKMCSEICWGFCDSRGDGG